MALTEILVHLEPGPRCSARLELTLALAQRYAAGLTGCYAVGAHDFAGDRAREPMADVRNHFEARLAERGVTGRWLVPESTALGVTVAEQLAGQALYADLVVVGQVDPRAGARHGSDPLVERLLQASGRPVLVVPYAGSFAATGTRVLVGWKGGRESGRAVFDALPLLRGAEQVSALGLIPAGAGAAEITASLNRLEEYLAGHGVTVRGERLVCSDISKADLLLNRAAEEGTDLLVVGALTQGRMGEVARHLLDHMTVPVLMSH